MRAIRSFLALFFLSFISCVSLAIQLPQGVFPDGYEFWDTKTMTCSIKPGSSVELRTHVLRGAEAIVAAVSVWYINGAPFEVKYFESIADRESLSGYRAVSITAVLDGNEQWTMFGGRGRALTQNELLYIRLLRYAQLSRHGITETEFRRGWSVCHRDEPGQMR